MPAPLVSVITVVYNAERLIERTIRSVAAQKGVTFEHIIMDGASKDHTLAMIHAMSNSVLRVYSESDSGIYDAMNKAMAKATGSFIIFMNAGDEFYDDSALVRAISGNQDADFIYGNTAVVDEKGNVLGDRRLQPPAQLNWRSLQRGMCVSHQSMLVRSSVAESYNLNYRISADIDWTIRMLKKSDHIVNANGYIAKFLEGGLSSSRRKEGLKERFRIMVKHYGWFTTVFNHAIILMRFVWHRITRSSMT
jgi:glycosyltransferase involved in cell wall biosynthesis